MNSILFIFQIIVVLSIVLLLVKGGKEYIIAFVGVCAVLANIYVLKQMNIFGLEATGGNVMYAAIFFATDILHEFFGKEQARKAVMVGFIASLVFLISSQFILLYEPNGFDFAQGSLETLFTMTPRIILGSLIAYFISQNLDIAIYHEIHKKTGQKKLWLRNNASTIVAQAVDTVIFHSIAFIGVLPWMVLINITVFTYILKVVVALCDTPFMYLALKVFKQSKDKMHV